MSRISQTVFVFSTLLPSAALWGEIATVRVASGLNAPLYATAAPGDPNRLFIVEQGGAIKILNLTTRTVNGTSFLTLPGGGLAFNGLDERGLLGMAFHPEFNTPGNAGEGQFYVSYTATGGGGFNNFSTIEQYQVSAGNPDVADSTPVQTILTIGQPQGNHNGGWIGFNPKINPSDNQHLYIAIGDGGGSDDNDGGHTAGIGNAQDITNNLLGKMLRIDVNNDAFPNDTDLNYAVPTDNPFVNETGDDEIWAYGLRNPWRNSFDRQTGDLYMGDVGQLNREEINFQPADSEGGENYGWRLREGTIATPTPTSNPVGGDKPADAIDPIYDYTRGSGPFQGRTVTGGYVYRGPIAELQGMYFFADFSTDRIWSLQVNGSDPSLFDGTNFIDLRDWTDILLPDIGSITNITSFGEDALGNLYIIDGGGEVFMIVPEPSPGVIVAVAMAGVVYHLRRRFDRPFGRKRH